MPPLRTADLADRHHWPEPFAEMLMRTSAELGHVTLDKHGYWHPTPQLEAMLGRELRGLEPDGGECRRDSLSPAPPPADLLRKSSPGFR